MTIIRAYIQLVKTVLYFFSTPLLVRTFITPWKRFCWNKTRRGFHPTEILFIVVSNLFSRLIGMLLRAPLIIIGLYATGSALILGLPLVFVLMLVAPCSFVFEPDQLRSIRPVAWDWHYGYTTTLDQYTTELRYKRISHPLVGKQKELERLTHILSQSKESNALVVGQVGSGRTALLTMAAHYLPFKRFLLLDYHRFFKDKATKQERQGSLEEVLQEANEAGNVILVVENVEQLLSFIPAMEHCLESGSLHLVGIATKNVYHQKLINDESFIRHFSVVDVEPLTDEQVYEVVVKTLEYSYKISLPQKTIGTLVSVSYDLQPRENKHQPEAALTLLDEFLTYHKTTDEKKHAHDWHRELQSFLESRLEIPFTALSAQDKNQLSGLEDLLHQRIIGQDEAISQIANAIRRNKARLTNKHKPIGSFLFLGPTGVGKTETAKALAAIFFMRDDKLVRFDMAGYNTEETTAKFVNEFAKAVREVPYAVLLLDELEKAHKDIFNILLTVLDEGYFVDENESKVLCNNLIIIATSNAAGEFIRQSITSKENSLFLQNVSLTQKVVDYILRKHIFSPDFINRFDAVVAYAPLSEEELKKIAKQKLTRLQKRAQKEHGKTFEISEALIGSIVKEGAHKEFGARELDRTIDRLVEDKLARKLLEDQ